MTGCICWCTDSGLGHLARDFHRHGLVQRALVMKHPHYPSHPDWYAPEARFDKHHWRQFLDGLTTLLLFETAVGGTWDVVAEAKRRGLKVVLCPMYEWSPFPPPVKPDLVLCPSLLDAHYYQDYKHVFIPIPVEQTWRLRERARTFIHNAGHGQHDWGKGTLQVIEAMNYVGCPVMLQVRLQPGERRTEQLAAKLEAEKRAWPRKFEVVLADLPEEELYATGDVFLNAEQLNGCSLPLQEAHAAGMLVMTTDRHPANTWLPREPLLPVERVTQYRIPGGSGIEFDRSWVNPKDIAAAIDAWFNCDIRKYSEQGREWAIEHSWERLAPRYQEALSP